MRHSVKVLLVTSVVAAANAPFAAAVGAGAPAAVLSGTGGQTATAPVPARVVGLAAGFLALAPLGTLLLSLRRVGRQ